MKKEACGQLVFLDMLVTRRDDHRLGHSVYRKPTHTDHYLHRDSTYHLRQKHAVMETLLTGLHIYMNQSISVKSWNIWILPYKWMDIQLKRWEEPYGLKNQAGRVLRTNKKHLEWPFYYIYGMSVIGLERYWRDTRWIWSLGQHGRFTNTWNLWRMPEIRFPQVASTGCLAHVARYVLALQNAMSILTSWNTRYFAVWVSQKSHHW